MASHPRDIASGHLNLSRPPVEHSNSTIACDVNQTYPHQITGASSSCTSNPQQNVSRSSNTRPFPSGAHLMSRVSNDSVTGGIVVSMQMVFPHALRGVLTCGHAHAFSHFLLNSTLPDPLIAPHVQRARSATCRETAFPHWVPACLVNRSRVSHNAAQRWYKWLPGGRKREQVYRRWHVLCAQPI